MNAVAGEDLKVLVARVTTCSDFTIRACIQTYVGGDQDSVQQFCPEPLLVLHQGCTEEGACNYNPLATTDDDSCVFDDGIYGCDGECFNDEDGDGICDEFEIEGCTGKGACNYNADATDDDDSRFYPGEGCDDGFELTVGDVVSDNCECLGYSCYDETARNYSTEGIEDNSVCSYIRNTTSWAALTRTHKPCKCTPTLPLQDQPTSGRLWVVTSWKATAPTN